MEEKIHKKTWEKALKMHLLGLYTTSWTHSMFFEKNRIVVITRSPGIRTSPGQDPVCGLQIFLAYSFYN